MRGVVIVSVPMGTTEVVGVNTSTGNTTEPTPLEARLKEVKMS